MGTAILILVIVLGAMEAGWALCRAKYDLPPPASRPIHSACGWLIYCGLLVLVWLFGVPK
jgi:hypothetical protein